MIRRIVRARAVRPPDANAKIRHRLARGPGAPLVRWEAFKTTLTSSVLL